MYFTGDGALRDEEGLYRITGRVDDIIMSKGHRIGTAELECAMVSCTILYTAHQYTAGLHIVLCKGVGPRNVSIVTRPPFPHDHVNG